MSILSRRPASMAFLLYLVLALALTSPRLLGSGVYVADDWHDNEIFFWNFWWLGEALKAGQNPWYTHAVFYPAGTSLGFHPTAFLYAVFSLPFQALLGAERGIILAYNLITLMSLTLSGFFAFLLARRLTGQSRPALLGGIFFGFSAYHFWHLGRLHVGSIEWLPLFLLLLVQLTEEDRRPWRQGIGLGATAVVILYTSLVNFSAAFLIGVLMMGSLWWRERRLRRVVLLPALLAVVITLIAMTPFLYAWTALAPPVSGAHSVAENIAYSADPAGYLLPGTNSRLYGWLASSFSWNDFGGREIFLGFLPWLLVPFALGGSQRSKSYLWIGCGGFFILSLGPVLQLFGLSTGLPLPYAAVYELVPLFQVNRTPIRYAAPFHLFLSLVLAFGAGELLRRWRWRPLFVVLLLLATGESWFRLPLMAREPAPAVYAMVAAAPADTVVLNVPLYHARVDRRIMYHQVFHRHPLSTACIPRASDTPHALIEGTQLRACLLEAAACQRAEPSVVAREIRERRIGFVLLHSRHLEPGLLQEVDRLLRRAGPLERVEDQAGIIAFRF